MLEEDHMRSMIPKPCVPGNTSTTSTSSNPIYHQALVLGLLEKCRKPSKPNFDIGFHHHHTTMNAMMPLAYGGYASPPFLDMYTNPNSMVGSQCLQMSPEAQMQPANPFTCTVRTEHHQGNGPEQRPPRAFTIEAILGLDSKSHNYHHVHLGGHHLGRASSMLTVSSHQHLRHHSVDKRGCWTSCSSSDSAASMNVAKSGNTTNSTTTAVAVSAVPKRKLSSGCKELKRSVTSGGDGSCSGDEVDKPTAKSKRVRTIFTPEQLERLESEFERQQYMVGSERLYLASSLNLTEAQVKVWFQNRRIKWRRQHLAIQQARLAKIRAADENEEEGKECEIDDADSTEEDFTDESGPAKSTVTVPEPNVTYDL